MSKVTYQSDQPATPPSGMVVATDIVANENFQKVKLDVGAVGESSPVTALNPMPVAGSVTTGGLTNTELRATPVPVSGPLTDTQLRAAAVPVSGPLTDTQLRASNVGASIVQNVVADTDNSSTANLNAGSTFTGVKHSTLGVSGIQIVLKATVASGTCTCTVYVDQSGDGTNYDVIDQYSYYSNRQFGITVQAVGSHYRVRVTNTSAGNTTALRLNTALCPIVEALPRSLDAIGHLRTSDYPNELMVARGLVLNNIAVTKFGRNPDIDIGTEDIWGVGGTWVAPTAARKMNVVSSSANDGAGTLAGALTVRLYGLNADYADTNEVITMNGTGAVATVNTYWIVYRMLVLTAGSNGGTVGTITATAQTDTTVQCQILPLKNQSQFGIYQIPAGYTGYLWRFGGSMNGAVDSNVDLELFGKPLGGVWNLKGTINMNVAAGACERVYTYPMSFTEKTIIKLTGTSDKENSNVVGNFDMVLVAN